MNSDEFFNNNHIDTIEKAKTAYILCNCNKYFMWHDFADKLKEYEALGISREQELDWTKEQFIIELRTVKQFQCEGKEWWFIYIRLIEKLCSLKEKSLFNMALDLTSDLIKKNIEIDHYHMIAAIIGSSGSKTHGGLIEYAMINGYLDIGQRAFFLANKLIDKVYPIISSEQRNHLNWLYNNMKDELIVWPELNTES